MVNNVTDKYSLCTDVQTMCNSCQQAALNRYGEPQIGLQQGLPESGTGL